MDNKTMEQIKSLQRQNKLEISATEENLNMKINRKEGGLTEEEKQAIKELQNVFKVFNEATREEMNDINDAFEGLRETIQQLKKITIESENEQLQKVYRMAMNNGLSDLLFNLRFVNKNIDSKQDLLSYIHKTPKGNEIRIVNDEERGRSASEVIDYNYSAVQVLIYTLIEFSFIKEKEIRFNLDDYFNFHGIQKQTKNIDYLEQGLMFLSQLRMDFKTTYKGKVYKARGNFLMYNIITEEEEGKPPKGTVSIHLNEWADILMENMNQFMLLDSDVFKKINQSRYPKMNTVLIKLFERYRNNVHNRKGRKQEKISVAVLIHDGLSVSRKLLKKKGYENYLISLERHLNHAKELGFIKWRYENKKYNKSNKDYYNDNIIFQPLNEKIIEEYKKIVKGRRKNIKKEKNKGKNKGENG